MNSLLKRSKNIYKDACVSIIFNTHRTKPDYQKDPIKLKNLIKLAEERLLSQYDKKLVSKIMGNINDIAEKIDHSHNLESMLVFANDDFADYTRLPIQVEDRVVIDKTFATRDLVRSLHQEASYYILVLSRHKARLIEAYNDKIVQEFQGIFPIENDIYETDKLKLSMAKGQDNLIEEFFRRVDKNVLETINGHALPILLATETRNYDHYLKVASKKDLIVGHVNRNRDDEEAHHIIPDAWKEIHSVLKMKHTARIAELEKAISEKKLINEYNDIWSALMQGRGQTLFVKKGFFQPAILKNDIITPTNGESIDQESSVDDIIDEMIEQNLAYGGDTVFIEGDGLKNFGNIALITRY